MGRLSNTLNRLIPAVCDVSVTNVCNATCDFCSFAYDKGLVRDRRWIDAGDFARALPILARRAVRYLGFQGGEPLLHPSIASMVGDARKAGMRVALITNGWLLPQKIERLAAAGLGTLFVSIDSHSMEEHERNRGLQGLGERIREGIARARSAGITSLASVAVNRLIDYDRLPDLLGDLGFEAVSFSYPRRAPFGSSSLVYSEESPLIDFSTEELDQALQSILGMKPEFPVMNPTESVADIRRHLRGEREMFPCVGGHKYFYLDWNLQIWRCEAWSEPFGSVFDFDEIADRRDRCTDCIMGCYRDTSVSMHAPIAAVDSAIALASGELGGAVRTLARGSVARSAGSLLGNVTQLWQIGRRRPAPTPPADRADTPAPSEAADPAF